MPKKNKKSNKHKSHKDKKHKKHKKKYSESESSSSSSGSGSSSECEWVEKKTTESKLSTKRDSWMMEDSFVPTYSIHDKKLNKKEAKKQESFLDKPGQSDRELNPYWKNGGTGLPEPEPKYSSCNRSPDVSDYYRSKSKKGFMRPEDDDKRNYSVFDRPQQSKSRWRKPAGESKQKSQDDERKCRKKEELRTRPRELEKSEESERLNEASVKSSSMLSDEEMNALASKILKAEIMGNTSLVNELKEKLDNARQARQEQKESDSVILLTNVNSKGFVQPMKNVRETFGNEKRKRKYETHVDGQRVRYFEDDEKYSLTEMFEREQMKSAADSNLEFAQLASKSKRDKDYAIDDLFMEQTTSNKAKKDREMQNAVDKQRKSEKALEDCYWCLTNNKIKKHLVISNGTKCYLSVPHFQSLTEGHCLIVPSYHSTCITLLDEDVWQEIADYCRKLVKMFREQDQDVVFFETAMRFKYYPHMVLHCVPIPYESGNLAPIYFKKAILECEKEWAINKKLVEYKKMDVKRVIPKGLPYFMVNFGMDSGFAHVIEEEEYFPKNFAQEIIGGILDLDHRIWRKQQNDDFETQCKKVNSFKELWKRVEPS